HPGGSASTSRAGRSTERQDPRRAALLSVRIEDAARGQLLRLLELWEHLRLHHVQLAMPPGDEEAAAKFYGAILGLTQVEKPPELAPRGGVWFREEGLELHLGFEEPFTPA